MFNSSDFTAVKKSASMRMGEFEPPKPPSGYATAVSKY